MTSWLEDDGGLDITRTSLENDDLAVAFNPPLVHSPFALV